MNGPHGHNPHLHQLQMQQHQQQQQQQQHVQYAADPTQMHRANIDSASPFPSPVQKQEITSPAGDLSKPGPSEDKKPQVKPTKTLNRVPRACNACRKQKMRCEGADNPPCRRCRHAGLECLFEKPSREPTLTGEAGLERIRSLEAQVADIRTTQHSIHSTLLDLVSTLRGGSALVGPGAPSPAFRPVSAHQVQSPVGTSPYHVHSPASSLGTAVPMPPGQPSPGAPNALPPMLSPALKRSAGPGYPHPHSQPFPGQGQAQAPVPSHQGPGGAFPSHSLPSISSLHPPPPPHNDMAPPQGPGRRVTSGGRNDNGKRGAPSSNVTSANSSDDEDTAELPASGLVAPWEVLRGLADAAAERAAKENGESEPPSRTRSHSPMAVPPHFHSGHNGNEDLNGNPKPSKRRKMHHRGGRNLAFPDVVTKNIITEQEARDLFRIFYQGCSTFLSVFDAQVDTFDALHERSPFAVDCICMVAARVKCGGGPPSETFKKCLEEVQSISCATLFSPVSRQEAVQAMVLVSGWSDNGWLSGGHAVRMALEVGMNKAWPRLLRRINANKMSTTQEERELVISARTWFCLYLFEHQMSYGVGRPAILRFDDSVRDCRLLLRHPLSIQDDMRLVSTVELMAIREKVHNRLAPLEQHTISDETFVVLREADFEFRTWFEQWDQSFSQKFPDARDAGFYRQSLQIQQIFAELFHNATALRGINRPEDVANMPPAQKHVAVRCIEIAKAGLEISLGASAYRENLKYAVHYTHATATFGASLLIRLARLLPENCDLHAIKKDVEELANVLEQTPSGRYARSLRYMLRRAGERRVLPEHSPRRPPREDLPPEHRAALANQPRSPTQMFHPSQQHHHQGGMPFPPHMPAFPGPGGMPPGQQWYDPTMEYGDSDANAWATMELNAGAVAVNGMEAYMIPVGYDQHMEELPQIW
ncbi:hypothetical protein K439DRAFT_1638799 [Ramaria rubella]|nr:hypothetical protein K439DRAFT_1638799 [Ramaria rubella]